MRYVDYLTFYGVYYRHNHVMVHLVRKVLLHCLQIHGFSLLCRKIQAEPAGLRGGRAGNLVRNGAMTP